MGVSNKTWNDNASPTCNADDLNGFNLEINNAILDSVQTLSYTDREQLAKGLANMSAVGNYFIDNGAVNAYVLSSVGARKLPTAYIDGMLIYFLPTNSNTGASTVAVGTLGVKNILSRTGSALIGGELLSSRVMPIRYSSSAGAFLLQEEHVTLERNNFVIAPTTNTSFASNANNNPYTFYFDDGMARYGVERIHFMGFVEIRSEENMPVYDSAGKKGYHPITAREGKVRYDIGLYGNAVLFNDSDGVRIVLDGVGDYLIYTGILNKFNILSCINVSGYRNSNNAIYLDGANTGNVLSQVGSDVYSERNYSANQSQNCLLSTTQGIHTVKIINGTDASIQKKISIYGIEVVNEAYSVGHEICVTACQRNIQGTVVNFSVYTGATALPLKGSTNKGGQAITGTKGGFASYYADIIGLYISKVTEPVGTIQTGVARYNGASSDTVDGLSDSSKFYANGQGNLVRVKDATVDRMLLIPTGAGAGSLTFANDFDGVPDTTLFAGNKQFQDDGSTPCVIAPDANVTIELYAKIGTNADHTNEELYEYKAWSKVKNKVVDRYRTMHYGDFGNQRSDDFTSVFQTATNSAYTMDDGCSTLIAQASYVQAGTSGLFPSNVSSFIRYNFYGTGIDIETHFQSNLGAVDNHDVYIDGVLVLKITNVNPYEIKKICSDLPLGFHTILINRTVASVQGISIINFYVYRPKEPILLKSYNFEYYNFLLADYIKTTLPTLNLSTYNGAIDQGVIRKSNTREFIYTGSGTWTYEAVATGKVSGRWLYLPASNDGNVKTTVFGSGQFRWWLRHQSNSDTVTISKDGVALETAQALGSVNLNGRAVPALNIGAECLCTLDVERVINTNGEFDHDCLDYHAPVFNQFFNVANPYPDYLMGQVGVEDNRKLFAFDERPEKRIISVICTLARTVTNGTFQQLVTICCDFENIKASVNIQEEKNSGSSTSAITGYLYKDGIDTAIAPIICVYNAGGVDLFTFSKTLKAEKRIRISLCHSAGANLYANNINLTDILKIEEK